MIMTYAATWTNGNAQGRLEAGIHRARDEDPAELAQAVNRRRRLVYLAEQDFSSQIGPLKLIRGSTLAGQSPPPFRSLRDAVTDEILSPAVGGLGGQPPTPAAMDWLWPVAGPDENQILVAREPEPGEVGLFEELNGTSTWTHAALTGGRIAIRAVHFNELRQAVEWIRRGRWLLPIYFSAGIFSPLPNTGWIGDSIANNRVDELRSIGFALARTEDAPPLGLTDVTVRPGSRIELTADTDCQVEVFHCLRRIDFVEDSPTWNEYDPSESAAWDQPGGTGAGDAAFIGSMSLSAGVPGQLSGSALSAAVQQMIDGAEQNFLVRRSDVGNETIGIAGELLVEFDVDSPPN